MLLVIVHSGDKDRALKILSKKFPDIQEYPSTEEEAEFSLLYSSQDMEPEFYALTDELHESFGQDSFFASEESWEDIQDISSNLDIFAKANGL